MNPRKIFSIVFCIVVVAFSLIFTFSHKTFVPRSTAITAVSFDTPIQIGDTPLLVSIADTDTERVRGLSGSTALYEGTGMLFIFDHPDIYAFWMKDMKYPLDMIWLSSDKSVVHIEKNISPDTYPESFSGNVSALFVLEVPAGFVDNHGIVLGSSFYFK